MFGQGHGEGALSLLRHFPVQCAGFTSDIATLYAHGWKIHADKDIRLQMFNVALVNEHLEIFSRMPWEVFQDFVDIRYANKRPPIKIGGVYPVKGTTIVTQERPSKFRPLEPSMQMSVREAYSKPVALIDLLDFEKPPEELIIRPKEVSQLMDSILEKQRPKQAELREKARKQGTKTRAKIISLTEYKAV